MKQGLLITLLLVLAQPVLAQQQTNLDSLRGLMGKWAGEGTSEAGAGGGFFTIEASLKDRVLIRKNHAEYPATTDRPAFTHDDLMVIYTDAATKKLRAFYTDSEGNTINYLINVSDDRKTITFLSDGRDPGPLFRLTYVFTKPQEITLTFEMAAADKPEQFRKLIDGKVRKVG